jgi:transposase
MSLIIRFGLDLAKNSFAICGVDAVERIQIRKTLSRSELLIFFSQQAPAIVAMESGSGAHHWARSLRAMGHGPRIVDPRFVAPYRHQGTAGKNDTNDAEAICEAAGRPRMRFVPIKRADQQAHVMVHRIRASVVRFVSALPISCLCWPGNSSMRCTSSWGDSTSAFLNSIAASKPSCERMKPPAD